MAGNGAVIFRVPDIPTLSRARFAERMEDAHRPGLPFTAESLRPGADLETAGPSSALGTRVLRNPAHLRKDSVRLEAVSDERGRVLYTIAFEVDCKQATKVVVYLAAEESFELASTSLQIGAIGKLRDPVRGPTYLMQGLRQQVVMPGPPLRFSELRKMAKVTSQAPDAPSVSQSKVAKAHAVVIHLSPANDGPGEGGLEEFTFCAVSATRAEQAAPRERSNEDDEDAPQQSEPVSPHNTSIKVRGQKLLSRSNVYAMRHLYGNGTDEDSSETEECVICMTDPREFAVLPCGHFCLCASCHASLLQPRSKCPICRHPVAAFLRLRNKPEVSEGEAVCKPALEDSGESKEQSHPNGEEQPTEAECKRAGGAA